MNTNGNFNQANKWYLQTWFIALVFAFSYCVFPIIIGVVLLYLHYKNCKAITEKYGQISELDDNIKKRTSDIEALNNKYSDMEKSLENKYNNLSNDYHGAISDLQKVKDSLVSEIQSLETDTIIAQYNFSDYDGISSEECKNKLSIIKLEEKELIKNNAALIINTTDSNRERSNNIKQLLRCFNAECDNALLNLSLKNIDTTRNKIQKAFETLNKIFVTDGISLSKEILENKLEQLNLAYTYELKKEQEREQQKAIREQMIEEEKVRREIEKEKAKLEKDQVQFNNEINKLMAYLQKSSSDIEKQLYADKIKDLEEKIKELEAKKESVLEREANARAGFVYVISNIGSFGENVFKIGMTRRLEPMDRIKELSSASVPFNFDVHAMIFSDDAPALESTLHNHFEKQSVNKVNLRKEFFNVSIDEIEAVVKESFNNTAEFIKIPPAEEYRQSMQMAN